MDLLRFLKRGTTMSAPTTERKMLMDTTAEVVADLLGCSIAEVAEHANSNPALEDLGDGVYRIWEIGDGEAFGLDQLRNAVAVMRKNAIPPKTVRTIKEARRLTQSDPIGRKWKVGEQYYEVHQQRRTFGVRSNVDVTGLERR